MGRVVEGHADVQALVVVSVRATSGELRRVIAVPEPEWGELHLQRHAHTRTGSRPIMNNRSTNGPKVILRSGTIVHPRGALEVGYPSGSATCATAVA